MRLLALPAELYPHIHLPSRRTGGSTYAIITTASTFVKYFLFFFCRLLCGGRRRISP